jgi:hypothetical protein
MENKEVNYLKGKSRFYCCWRSNPKSHELKYSMIRDRDERVPKTDDTTPTAMIMIQTAIYRNNSKKGNESTVKPINYASESADNI